jgi:hypothetical protein
MGSPSESPIDEGKSRAIIEGTAAPRESDGEGSKE